MELGLQLYTVRDHLEDNWESTLARVHEMGYGSVELAGDYGKTAKEWKSELDRLGLQVAGAHHGIDALEGKFDESVAFFTEVGCKSVFVPWVDKSVYEGGWPAFGKRMQILGERLADKGLALGYHNHDFEFRGGGEKPGLVELYEASDPKFVKAEVDVAWVQIGGKDPAKLIESLGPRATHLHLKDYDLSKTPQWVPAGQGAVHWKSILDAGKAVGSKFGIVELDESPGDSLEAAKTSLRYFQGLGLK